ncbi:MAG: hypothetical protein Fur003_2570 [Candidatus Dojkabacteria bacterium]
MKLLKSALISAAIVMFTSLSVLAVNAQTDTIETAHDQELENLLLLQIPEETDNPNFTITFTDPSKKGVTLELDGQKAKKITSPYLLPSLAIGDHKLVFKFTDKEDTAQELIKTLVVVPRVPLINPPESVDSNIISLTGTGLAGSKLELFLTGATDVYTAKVDVAENGEWEYVFKEDFKAGIYTVVGVIKRDGYASTYSDPVVFNFEIDTNTKETDPNITDLKKDITFSLQRFINNDPLKQLMQNPDLIYVTVGILLLGLILGNLLGRMFGNRNERVAEKMFMRMLNRDEKEIKKQAKKEVKKIDKKQMMASKDIKAKLLGSVAKSEAEKAEKEEDEAKVESDEEADPSETSENKEDKKEKTSEKKSKEEKGEKSKTKSAEVTTDEVEENDTEEESETEEASEEKEQATDSEKLPKVELTIEEEDDENEDDSPDKVAGMTKDEFMKRYKAYDPDNAKGEEAESEETELEKADAEEIEPEAKADDEENNESDSQEDEEETEAKKLKKAKAKKEVKENKERNIKITLTSKSLD